jgi:hypothetical protein
MSDTVVNQWKAPNEATIKVLSLNCFTSRLSKIGYTWTGFRNNNFSNESHVKLVLKPQLATTAKQRRIECNADATESNVHAESH